MNLQKIFTKIKKSAIGNSLLHLMKEFVYVLTYIIMLSIIAMALNLSPIEEDFKVLFREIHKITALMNYLLFTLRGLLRLVIIPLRRDYF